MQLAFIQLCNIMNAILCTFFRLPVECNMDVVCGCHWIEFFCNPFSPVLLLLLLASIWWSLHPPTYVYHWSSNIGLFPLTFGKYFGQRINSNGYKRSFKTGTESIWTSKLVIVRTHWVQFEVKWYLYSNKLEKLSWRFRKYEPRFPIVLTVSCEYTGEMTYREEGGSFD